MRPSIALALALAALALPTPSTPNVAAPSRAAQSAGPYTGVATGLLDRYRHIDNHAAAADRIVTDAKDVYVGRFTYSFHIDEFGNVTGSGTGTYLAATWHLEGVNGSHGPFSCDVPMFTQAFGVRVTGQATADAITVRFAMEGSREWNDEHLCGANYYGLASDGARLADSLELVQPRDGIAIPRANPRIGPLRKVEVLGDDRDSRVNLHEWTFTIAGPGATPPPPPPPPGPGGSGGTAGGPPPLRLVGTVGPRATIRLTLDGRPVRILPAARYTVLVRDRSRAHNFRLSGPGVNRATAVRSRSTVTWNVTLRRGTYGYLSDPQPRRLRGTVLVR